MELAANSWMVAADPHVRTERRANDAPSPLPGCVTKGQLSWTKADYREAPTETGRQASVDDHRRGSARWRVHRHGVQGPERAW